MRILRTDRHPRTPCRRRMKRCQVTESVNGFRFYEGTRERCFAPIRERQILRHDVNLSQYQVEGCGPGAIACGRASLRRVTACGPGRCPVGPPTSGGPRRALCAIGAAASRTRRLRARPPRAGRSSLDGLPRGRWAGRAPFSGWGRCGRLFSAPPMCQAGWSRGPWWLNRYRLLSGGDLKSGPSGRLGRKRPRAPRKRGAAPPSKRRRCRRNDPRRTIDRATGRTLLRIRAQ